MEQLPILLDALCVFWQTNPVQLRIAIVDTAAVSLAEGFRLGVPNGECFTVIFIFNVAEHIVTICNV